MSKLIVCLGDVHVPMHHKRATAAIFNMLADRRPDECLQVGDLIDMEPVSRWTTGTRDEDGRKLQYELEETRKWLADWDKAFPGRKTYYKGNHDDRMDTYCRTKAKGLFGLEDLTLGKLLRFDEHHVLEQKQPYAVAPGVVGIHGTKLGLRAGQSVQKEMDRHMCSVVMGHCHRQALVWKTDWNGGRPKRRFGLEVGHMCDQSKAHYLGHGVIGDWQLGLAALWVDGNDVVPELVPLKDNGSFTFDGRKYSA